MRAARVDEPIIPECTTEDVRASWSEVARRWSYFVRSGLDVHRDLVHGPAMMDACGDVGGLRVLDIGCGEGWCSRQLARRGARVAAVDLSAAMIAEARTLPAPQVEYRVMDAGHVDRQSWRFDLVAACMSLHSMPDPEAALSAARGVLADDGRLVCSIPHPATHASAGGPARWAGERLEEPLYYRPAGACYPTRSYRVWWTTAGEEWPTIRWNRPLSVYRAMLATAGFIVQDLLEPCPSQADVDKHERLSRAGRVPNALVLVARPRR